MKEVIFSVKIDALMLFDWQEETRGDSWTGSIFKGVKGEISSLDQKAFLLIEVEYKRNKERKSRLSLQKLIEEGCTSPLLNS